MKYEIIYSDRKTLSLIVKDASLTVRAPRGTKKEIIEKAITKNREWIEKKLTDSQRKKDRFSYLTDADIKALKKSAKEYFVRRTEEISRLTGLGYGKVKITSAKGRFGSCNSKGNICFSYRLMLYPEAAREYVILHELAHTREMNHSKNFYKIIERFMPDYKKRKQLLK